MLKLIATLGTVTLATATLGEAATVPISGGVTTVEVTADLAGLGLTGAPFGTAGVDVSGPNPVFAFDITGGSVDDGTGAALIEHDGSGVTLTSATQGITIGNFLIDTDGANLSGDVVGGATGIAFFDLGTPTVAGIPLLITADLSGVLSLLFGAPDLVGAEFGIANTAPEVAPVPLPASLPMLLGALVVAGVAARRRAARR
ncbi:MAG: PEP-CTERM sorting domain-containing protein [Pseudomonadota bacterium]